MDNDEPGIWFDPCAQLAGHPESSKGIIAVSRVVDS
jgi:hypothetical protein